MQYVYNWRICSRHSFWAYQFKYVYYQHVARFSDNVVECTDKGKSFLLMFMFFAAALYIFMFVFLLPNGINNSEYKTHKQPYYISKHSQFV